MIKLRDLFAKLATYLGILIILGFALVPVLWLLVSSFKTKSAIFAPNASWIPHPFTFMNYQWAFSAASGTDLVPTLWNSVVTSFGTAVLTIVLACLGGYALGRRRFPGYTLVLGILMVAQVFQGPLIMIPWYKMTNFLGILDTKTALILIYGTATIPLGMVMLSGFFRGIPIDLEEAAYVDGCTKFKAFFRIILPLTIPGIVSVFIYSFIVSWNDYQYALILTSSLKSQTVQIALQNMVSSMGGQNWGGLLSSASIATIPVVVLFAAVQRYLIQGLTSGAVKG